MIRPHCLSYKEVKNSVVNIFWFLVFFYTKHLICLQYAQYVLDVLSLKHYVPWEVHPLNDVSLVGQHISWTMRPLYDASLTDVSRSMIEVLVGPTDSHNIPA